MRLVHTLALVLALGAIGALAHAGTIHSKRLDRDGDGLKNRAERRLGTNPDVADSDGDGLSDGQEVRRLHTDPLSPDTDGDGVADGDEVAEGTDPRGDGSASSGDPTTSGDHPSGQDTHSSGHDGTSDHHAGHAEGDGSGGDHGSARS